MWSFPFVFFWYVLDDYNSWISALSFPDVLCDCSLWMRSDCKAEVKRLRQRGREQLVLNQHLNLGKMREIETWLIRWSVVSVRCEGERSKRWLSGRSPFNYAQGPLCQSSLKPVFHNSLSINYQKKTLVSCKTSLRKAYCFEKHLLKKDDAVISGISRNLAVSEFPPVSRLKQVEVRNLCHGNSNFNMN